MTIERKIRENFFMILSFKPWISVLGLSERKKPLGKEVPTMDEANSTPAQERDEELADTLLAISIVAKRLAHKLRIKKGENQSEE